jgi:hypothetical protein
MGGWVRISIRLSAVLATTSMLALTGAHSETLSFGIGGASCAHWKEDNRTDYEGKTWVLGCWSGLNAASNTNTVGIDTDTAAINAEVALICARSPSMKLQDATIAHYMRVRAEDAARGRGR